MGAKYSITDNAVGQHATNLDTSIASLNANLTQFINAVSSLPGAWKGSAYTSFEQLKTQWENSSRDLNKALSDIRQRVGGSAQVYDTEHSQQTADLNKINTSANWDAAKFRG